MGKTTVGRQLPEVPYTLRFPSVIVYEMPATTEEADLYVMDPSRTVKLEMSLTQLRMLHSFLLEDLRHEDEPSEDDTDLLELLATAYSRALDQVKLDLARMA